MMGRKEVQGGVREGVGQVIGPFRKDGSDRIRISGSNGVNCSESGFNAKFYSCRGEKMKTCLYDVLVRV